MAVDHDTLAEIPFTEITDDMLLRARLKQGEQRVGWGTQDPDTWLFYADTEAEVREQLAAALGEPTC